MISQSLCQDRVNLTMSTLLMGKDLHISLYGGQAPHIGAVALGIARKSLKDNKAQSASVSVLTVLGHKEDNLAKHVAHTMAAHTGQSVCVACGIHIPNINQEEINTVLTLTNMLMQQTLHKLGFINELHYEQVKANSM